MSVNLGRAIFSLRPNCEFTLQNHDYSTIEWIVLEGEAPTAKEVEAEIKKIEAADAAKEAADAQAKGALLDRLGITADEAKLLLG
jgi:hypothetical protein